MRQAAEVEAEIEALRALKGRVPRHGFSGNNRDAIGAQIEVLTHRMGNNAVYDRWGEEESDEFSQYVLDSAVDASRWLYDSSGEVPSKGWVELAA